MPLKRRFFVTIFLTLLACSWVRADEAAYPLDLPALRVHSPGQPVRTFTLRTLQSMPATTVTARGPADDRVSEWRGVPLAYLLRQLHVRPPANAQLRMRALNDYSVIIPASDISRYSPVIAYQRDGQPMPVESLGPLFLMYPFDQHHELRTQKYYNRAIWQLSEIFIE